MQPSSSDKPVVSKTLSATPSLLKAAGLIALVTIASKILGAARDWAIFNVYGASMETDAYFAAVQLPWFAIVLLGGLGGPFHTATVAVFSKLIKQGELPDQRIRDLANTFITLTVLVFLGLSVLVWQFASPIMGLLLQNADPYLIEQSVVHLKVMTPVIFIGGLIGVFYGLLNVYNVYFWPSLSPAAMSVVMIAMIFINPADREGSLLLAYATVSGALCQFLMQLPDVIRYGFSWKPAWKTAMPEIRQLGEVMFPIIIGTTIGQLMVYVDMTFVSYLDEGGWAAIVLSNRLVQLPIGVLQTAFLIPIFPRFSRYVADAQWVPLKQDFKKGVVSLWFISIPILVIILLDTEPLIRIVFEHGRFDQHDTEMVTLALVFQAFQMLPYFVRDTLTRVFYAFNDSVTPMLVGFLALGIKFGLNGFLVQHYGLGGITLATTLITAINMVILGGLLKRYIPDMGYQHLIKPFLKLCLSGILMAGCMIAINALFKSHGMVLFHLFDERIATLLSMSLTAGMGTLVYMVFAFLFQVPEVRYLYHRIREKYFYTAKA